MPKRDATSPQAQPRRLRRAFLLLIVLVLAGGAIYLGQLQKPVVVILESGKDKPFQELFVRLEKECRNHPDAPSVAISKINSQSTLWDKIYNVSQILSYYRKQRVLKCQWSMVRRSHNPIRDTWTYVEVKPSDLSYLARANIGKVAISLPTQVGNQLRKNGCFLVARSD